MRLDIAGNGLGAAIAAYKASPSNGPGRTANNFNGASNDPWTNSDIVGSANVGGSNDAALLSFSAVAIRPSDGKICAMGTGGHTASAISGVFCFDTMAAAASKNGGGPGGSWYIATAPARFLGCADARPAWQPQGFSDCSGPVGPVGWTFTNPSGQQMPISCHEYWSNKWIPNTHHLIWSGFFCGYNGGNTIGGAGWYDDDTAFGTDLGTVHFPVVIDPTYMGWSVQAGGSNLGPGAFNDLDKCWYSATSDGFHDYLGFKWCNIDTAPVKTSAFSTGTDGPGNNIQAIMVPDPTSPATLQWFMQWAGVAAGCGTGFPCFLVFRGVGGTVAYQHLVLTTALPVTWGAGAPLVNDFCYDSALNAILATQGTQHIYKVGDLTANGTVTNNTSSWGFVEYTSSPGGITPGSSANSGTPWSCASLEPNYHAVLISGISDATSQIEVDLYVK